MLAWCCKIMSSTKRGTRALNLSLRAATLGSRFLLIFFLARFLQPSQLGLYGLLSATIGYSLYLLGFDFYTFTTREILKRSRKEWGGLLKDQAALSLLLYAIFLPLLNLVFVFGLLPWRLAGWFFALLVLEHINQEMSRLLVAISEQLLASILLFLRQGSWAITLTALMAFDPNARNLDYVFGAWTLSGLLAALAGTRRLAQMQLGGWHKNVDWGWIRTGLKISIPLLLATLAVRGAFTLDRYWLQALGGLEVLGAYVLFMGISGTLMAFLDAAVFAFSYPGLISASHAHDASLFRQKLRALLLQTLAISVGFAIVSTLALPFLLGWLDKPTYTEQQYLYPWVLAVMVLYALGMVPHYALYAQGLDRPIIRSHLASLVVFVASTAVAAPLYPQLAVVIGLCCAFLAVLIWKAWAFFAATPTDYWRTPS